MDIYRREFYSRFCCKFKGAKGKNGVNFRLLYYNEGRGSIITRGAGPLQQGERVHYNKGSGSITTKREGPLKKG